MRALPAVEASRERKRRDWENVGTCAVGLASENKGRPAALFAAQNLG